MIISIERNGTPSLSEMQGAWKCVVCKVFGGEMRPNPAESDFYENGRLHLSPPIHQHSKDQ